MSNRPFEEDVESNAQIARPRPEWFKLYYLRFADSTKLLDSEQVGWYWRLLLYAASQGEPCGYLNNDDDELRQIAEVKDMPAEEVVLLSKTSEGIVYLNAWKERQTKRWLKVRGKFRVSQANSNLLYNKMLVAILQEAYQRQDQAIESANTRWAEEQKKNQRQQKKLESKQQKTKQLEEPPPIELDDALPLDSKLPDNNGLNAPAYPSAIQQQCDITLISSFNTDSTSCLDSVDSTLSFEELRKSVVEKEVKEPRPSLLKRKAESLFEEERFEITAEMSSHLSVKHSDFVQGDWDYMVEEFKNVFYGKKKASWKRTFYTFVNNQRMRYSYEAGDYLKRQTHPNSQRNVKQPTSTSRHAEAERRADELSARYLQGSGVGNHQESEEALPLTSDDIRGPA